MAVLAATAIRHNFLLRRRTDCVAPARKSVKLRYLGRLGGILGAGRRLRSDGHASRPRGRHLGRPQSMNWCLSTSEMVCQTRRWPTDWSRTPLRLSDTGETSRPLRRKRPSFRVTVARRPADRLPHHFDHTSHFACCCAVTSGAAPAGRPAMRALFRRP